MRRGETRDGSCILGGIFMKHFFGLLMGTAIALAGAASALAGTVSTSMGVSAEVVPGCQKLAATPISFGSVPTGNAVRNATGTVTVTCSEGVPYNVTMDNGLCHPFLATQRKMGLAGNCGSTVDYEIYLDAAHTQRWHDAGLFSGTVRLEATGTGNSQTFTAFGQVSPTSSTLPGSYTDTVVVFLNF
jgi:spore coat protein U-like protein